MKAIFGCMKLDGYHLLRIKIAGKVALWGTPHAIIPDGLQSVAYAPDP
jgi:hypothetical protein